MQLTTQRPFVGLISRPKLNGPGQHAGVLLPNGYVAHMTHTGAEIITYADFSHGLTVKFEKAAPPQLQLQIQWRAYQAIGRVPPYDLLNRNCEHFATWLMGEVPKSPQVIGIAVLSIFGLIAAITS
jgi:hypothetical protein